MKTILKSSILTVTAILMTAVLSSYAPPDCPTQTGEATIYLPCPEDCNKFWECDNGWAVLQECPDGLHFNDYLDVCDWPEYAGCDKSYFPPVFIICDSQPGLLPFGSMGYCWMNKYKDDFWATLLGLKQCVFSGKMEDACWYDAF